MSMRFDISYILYGMAVVLAAAGLVVFGFDVLMSLSPTIRSFLLVLTFTFFVAAGNYTEDTAIRNIFYLISAVAYAIFLLYTFIVFDLSSEVVFVMLAISSIMFTGFGYMAKKRDLLLEHEVAKRVMVGTIVLTVIVLAGDLTGPQPSIETTYVDTVEVVDGEQQVGQMTITNPFIVSRDVSVDYPSMCLVAPEGRISRVPVDLDRRPSLLAGGETVNINVSIRLPYDADGHEGDSPWLGNYSTLEIDAESDQCPDTAETATLFVTETEDRRSVAFD